MSSIIPVNTDTTNIKQTKTKSLTAPELIIASVENPDIINKVTKNPETEMFDVNTNESIIIDNTKMSKQDQLFSDIENLKNYYKSQGIESKLIQKIITNSLTPEESKIVYTKILQNEGFTNNDIKRVLSGEITYEDLMNEIQNDKDTSRLEKLIQSQMLNGTGHFTIEEIDKDINNLDSNLQSKVNECTNKEQKYYMQQVLDMINKGATLDEALNTTGVPYDINGPYAYSNLNYKTLLTGENVKMLTDIYTQKQQLLADKEYVKTESKNYVENVLKYQLQDDYEQNSGQNTNDSSILNGILNSATPDASSPGNYLDYYVTSTEQKVAIISALINGNSSVTDGSYVNGVPISSNSDDIFNHYRQWYEVMTDEEKQAFNYVYNTKGADAAYEYLKTDSLQNSLDQRYYYQKQKYDSEWAKNNAVAASALSVVMTPVEGLGSMLSTNSTLVHNALTGDNKTIPRTDNISVGTNYRSAVSQDIGKKHGEVAKFAYDAGMSMADFAVVAVPTMATGGALMAGATGTTMLLSNMGTRVYVSAFNDAKDRGLSDADAVKEAWVYAGVETAIERIPLKNLSVLSKAGAGEAAGTLTYRATKNVTDRLLKNVSNPNTARRLTKAINMTGAIVSQSVTEGNEELATDIIDAIADDYIAGDKSTFNLKVDEYMAKGYSEDDAIAKTMQDTAKDWSRDWALGFTSGGAFGGIAGTVNNYQASGNNIGDITKAIVGNFKSSMFDQNVYLMPPFMSKLSGMFRKTKNTESQSTISTINNQETTSQDARIEPLHQLERFFDLDTEIKDILYSAAPKANDDPVEYSDKLWKLATRVESKLKEICRIYDYDYNKIKPNVEKAKDQIMRTNYTYQDLQRIYNDYFAKMDESTLKVVGENIMGYYDYSSPLKYITDNMSFNEILHVIHSKVLNDDRQLRTIDEIKQHEIDQATAIYLRGVPNQQANEIYEEMVKYAKLLPYETRVFDDTEIIAVNDNKILIMIRGAGHCTTIEINRQSDGQFGVSYFIPKINNEEMVLKLKGINGFHHGDEFARGSFLVQENELAAEVSYLINGIPSDYQNTNLHGSPSLTGAEYLERIARGGIDTAITSAGEYEFKEDHLYRKISQREYEKYLKTGYITGLEDDIIFGKKVGVDWYQGGVPFEEENRKIILECPYDEQYFEFVSDSKDAPKYRLATSSGKNNPIPLSKVRVVKYGNDYTMVDNDVLQEVIDLRIKELAEYAEQNGTTLEKLGEPIKKEEVAEVREIADKLAENLAISVRTNEPTITTTLQSFEDDNSYLINLEKRFKKQGRLSDKIIDKADGKNEDSMKVAADNIYDALRYTLIIDESNYNQKVADTITQLHRLGYEIVGFKNNWGKPYYQGINVKLRFNDTNFELQFHTEKSFKAKEGDTHTYYEIARNKHNKLVTPEIAAKADEIQKLYQGFVPIPKDAKYLRLAERR